MARIAHFVVPGLPHHVTQRGNRRETVFFSDADYELYRDLMGQQCRKHGVAVWAYCLMPDHIHLILVPDGIVMSTAPADQGLICGGAMIVGAVMSPACRCGYTAGPDVVR